MSEKHPPASANVARTRTERAIRHKDAAKLRVKSMHKQPRRYTQPMGFVRGARVRPDG